jgi:hypothetical protein
MPLQKDVAGPGGEGRGEGEKKEKKKGVEKERRIDDPAAGGRALRCICESRGTFRMSGGARERERERGSVCTSSSSFSRAQFYDRKMARRREEAA